MSGGSWSEFRGPGGRGGHCGGVRRGGRPPSLRTPATPVNPDRPDKKIKRDSRSQSTETLTKGKEIDMAQVP